MQHPRCATPSAGWHVYTVEQNLNMGLACGSSGCTPCSGVATKPARPDNITAVQRQGLLWNQSFLNSTIHSSVFRHKECLKNFCRSNGVNAQLAVLDKRVGGPPQSTSNGVLHLINGHPTVPECRGHESAEAVLELCGNGQLSRAVDALTLLAESNSLVSTALLYRVIQKCGAEKNLPVGRRLDDLVVKLGYESNAFLGNHILRMYASQGQLQEAMKVFNRVARPDVFMWFSIISAQAKHGNPDLAIQLYKDMRSSGLEPNAHVFVAALQACARAQDVKTGRQVHADVVESGGLSNIFVSNGLVDMYAKCGEIEDARRIFDCMITRDAVTWNAMINGYAEHGLGLEALTLYAKMEQEGLVLADSVTFLCLLKACGSAGALQHGRQLHSQIVKRGLLDGDKVLGTCLINMYAKCGKLDDAREVFDSLATRDAVTWNAMINGYAEHGLGQQAFALYARMEQDRLVLADRVTFVCLLKACASAGAVEEGRQLHLEAMHRGLLEGDSLVGACLVVMYVKCGKLDDARMVFDSIATRDVVAWTAMINGYVEHGLGFQALTLYERMEQEGLILADAVTCACLLRACASAGALQQGRQLHLQLVDRGLLEGNTIVATCLINMYAKCGELDDARILFDSLGTRDAVTWNTMISAYAEHDELGSEALTLYARMEQEGLVLGNGFTFACLLRACASAGALQQGRQLHSQIVERGLLECDIVLGNSLVNMYAKCGKMEDARMVFDSLATRDVVTWTAMISGYGTNNDGHRAISYFEEMIQAGVEPDDTSVTCLLVACSHEGLVSKGRQYFDAMVKRHSLNPTIEHYNCMVDLLGRAGLVDEAEKMLLSVGRKDNVVGLMSLLYACKSHGDLGRGERCFESLIELDPQNASPYVLMANMYANANRWADVDRVERLRKLAGANKKPAVAEIEVSKQVHTFAVGEEKDDVSCKARSTGARLKEEGNHVPHTKVVLKALTEKEKESDLCGHAEKLALAYGLLNTPEGTPLLVTKNLRMCMDCHTSTEIMSRVEKRDIVVRDAYRVHRFEAGFCSCNGRC